MCVTSCKVIRIRPYFERNSEICFFRSWEMLHDGERNKFQCCDTKQATFVFPPHRHIKLIQYGMSLATITPFLFRLRAIFPDLQKAWIWIETSVWTAFARRCCPSFFHVEKIVDKPVKKRVTACSVTIIWYMLLVYVNKPSPWSVEYCKLHVLAY